MASTARGNTGYVGITEKQVTSSSLGSPDSTRGNYSASSVLPASADRDRGGTGYVSVAQKQVSSAVLVAPDSSWGDYSASSAAPASTDRDRANTDYVGVWQRQVSSTTLTAPDSSWGDYSASSVAPARADRDRGLTLQTISGPSFSYSLIPPPTLDAFAADPILNAGRIVPLPASITPSDGAAVFCLGHDAGDLVEFFAPGDYVEVAQLGSLPAGNLLTFQARTRAARVAPPPTSYTWVAHVLVDGTVVGSRTIDNGSQVDWEWYVDLTAVVGASHTIALRLTLEGSALPGPPALPVFELGVPAFYIDNLRFSTGVGPFITNQIPVANQGQTAGSPPAASTSVAFEVFGLGTSVDPSTLSVTINGVSVVLAGALQSGVSGSIGGAGERLSVTLQPNVPFSSAEIVTVHASVADVGGSPASRSWTFQVIDTIPPILVGAQVLSPKQIRLTWNEVLTLADPAGAHDALNPALYTLAANLPDADTPAVRGLPDVALSPLVVSVTPADTTGYAIDLTTDVEISPGVDYLVTELGVADLVGNFESGGAIVAPGFDLPWPNGRVFDLLRWLPQMNRREDVTHDLVRFVRCLQEPANLLLYDIDRWTNILDVDAAPEADLDAMLADLGNPFPFVLTAGQKRLLVRTLVTLYGQKGTAPGILNAVRLLLGLTVTITGYTGETMALGVSELGGEQPPPGFDPASPLYGSWILGPGTSWALYAFRVVSAIALSPAQVAQITFIANYMKPGHTHLVEVVVPVTIATYDPVELGVSELGVDWTLHL
jgi:phage tail-like protein